MNILPIGPTTAAVTTPRARNEPPPTIVDASAKASAPASQKLTIEVDDRARRFVYTLLDGQNHTVVRRFPDDGQLAFSRGIAAYVDALRRQA